MVAELRPGFCERGYQSIKLSQYCGLVSAGERVVEVLPKVDEGGRQDAGECRGILLRLLEHTSDVPAFRDRAAGHQLRDAPLLDVFTSAFFDSVSELVRGGLQRDYELREDDLTVVRGRIQSKRQFAASGNRPDVVSCVFDELTPDHRWNRFLKAGLVAVRPWIANVDLSRRWIELMAAFDEVSTERTSFDALDRIPVDRRMVRYRPAITWARWILALLSPALRAGPARAPGLLFDMNELFQLAVAAIVRAAAPAAAIDVASQDTGVYLASTRAERPRPAFGLRPDLVLRRGRQVIAIADTKWKKIKRGSSGFLLPEAGDMYQMQAYAAAYRCNALALIYPWHADLAGSRETTFLLKNADGLSPAVSVVCIDVNADPYAVVRGASEIVGRLLCQEGLVQRDERPRAGIH